MSLASLRDTAPLLIELSESGIEFLESIATEMSYRAGTVLFEEDDTADTAYLIAEGKIGLEVLIHTRPPVLVETLGPGDLLGVSWLFPPYQWSWRARAMIDTTCVAFDAKALRERCDEDVDLALQVYKAVAGEAVKRLHAARIRLLDLYPGANI